MENTPTKKIVALGSLNCDLFMKMDRLPAIGETRAAENDEIFKVFGGKGANEAIACAKLAN